MRSALLSLSLALLLLAGCRDQPVAGAADLAVAVAPPDLGSSDLAAEMPDFASSPDLSVARDLAGASASDLGGINDPCVSACGCQQGLTCVSNKCQPTPALIYCCDRPLCPKGVFCQLPDGGSGKCP